MCIRLLSEFERGSPFNRENTFSTITQFNQLNNGYFIQFNEPEKLFNIFLNGTKIKTAYYDPELKDPNR